MKSWKERVVFLNNWVQPKSNLQFIFSLLLALLSGCLVVVKDMASQYQSLPSYSELVVGYTTWDGYNKILDVQVVQTLLVRVIILLVFYLIISNLWAKYIKCDKGYGSTFVLAYIFLLMSGFSGTSLFVEYGCILLVSVLLFLILSYQKTLNSKVLLHVYFITYLIQWLVKLGASTIVKFQVLNTNRVEEVTVYIRVAFVGACLLYAFVLRKKEFGSAFMKNVENALQCVLPLAFLLLYKFDYLFWDRSVFSEQQITLFYSNRLKLVCILLAVTGLAINVYSIIKKKNHSILSTFVVLSVLRVFENPSALMQIDFFHNGELMVPMQQLISYGKIPYYDFVPIHGFCDYFYGIVNYGLFDGTYLSLNSTIVVVNCVMAAVLAILIYFTVEKKELGLVMGIVFMPFLITMAGMRYFFMAIFFLVMLSRKIRSSGCVYLGSWIVLSILSIAWNPSIGGAVSLAFLPVVLMKTITLIPNEMREFVAKKQIRKLVELGVSYLCVGALGIAFIPWFNQIIIYLKENTGTTSIVNGMAIFDSSIPILSQLKPSLEIGGDSFFVRTFGFLISLCICLFFTFQKDDKEMRNKGWEMLSIFVVWMLVISNYAFVRYDEGLRTNVISIFFLFMILVFLFNNLSELSMIHWKKKLFAGIIFFLIIHMNYSMFSSTQLVNNRVYVDSNQEIEVMGKTVFDPIVYVTGESVGMPNLGTGFVSGDALNSLKNVQKVIQYGTNDKQSYFDITNAIANHVIFDKASATKYSSAYNISNQKMQQNAIEELKVDPPDMILVSPDIEFDETPFSLRSQSVYRYILSKKYVPYVYENVVYLLRQGMKPMEGSADGRLEFAKIMHKSDMGALPAIWSKVKTDDWLEQDPLGFEEDYAEIESYSSDDNGLLTIQFKEPINLKDINFIDIDLDVTFLTPDNDSMKKYAYLRKPLMKERKSVKLFFQDPSSENGLTQEPIQFTVYDKCNEYLIPVYSSPFWHCENQIDKLYIQHDPKDEELSMNIVYHGFPIYLNR